MCLSFSARGCPAASARSASSRLVQPLHLSLLLFDQPLVPQLFSPFALVLFSIVLLLLALAYTHIPLNFFSGEFDFSARYLADCQFVGLLFNTIAVLPPSDLSSILNGVSQHLPPI